ncbi:MAG: hypothetical protein GXC73_12000 [Chitinophagaceae bacterium]|nr:hypothetical protein [Chitinophagaceae bacterium]
MKFYVNDFSYNPGNLAANHRDLMEYFVDVCERAKTFKYEQLFMSDDFKVREIVAGLSFNSFILATQPTDNLRIRLRSILANQIKKIASDDPDESIQYVYWKEIESEFFKKAYNQNAPVASFRTDIEFDNSVFVVNSQTLMEDGSQTTTNGDIFNLSHSLHFQFHNAFLTAKSIAQAIIDSRWNALKEPLRFAARINQYLADIEYYEKLKGKGDTNFKRALFFNTGTEIAEMNGWTHDVRLSRINSTPGKKRKVFFARSPTAYLSIDFMHGAFELHDRNGIHIGEYNFEGVDLNSTYNDSSHNIKV